MSKKQKLLFYISAAYPLFAKKDYKFGGAEVNLYYISNELSNRGYEIEFLVADYEQDDIEVYNNIKVKKIKYFNINKYKSFKYKLLRRWNFIKLLWGSNVDILITSTASEMTGYMVFIAKLRKKKILFRVASDWDVDKTFTSASSITGLMYRYSLPKFDKIIVQNARQQTMLLENEQQKSIIIKNGFPLKEMPNIQKKDIVLWVGRDDLVKRPDLFIELAIRLKNYKFVMIMQGNNELKKQIEQKALKLDNLIFFNHISFFQIQEYFNRAICFVNTSEKEGFPNTFIQACIGHTPMLSYNVNPDNILNQYSMGYLCNNDINQAVEFIKSLNKEKINLLGKNAFYYVKQEHDLSEKINQYEKIIKELE